MSRPLTGIAAENLRRYGSPALVMCAVARDGMLLGTAVWYGDELNAPPGLDPVEREWLAGVMRSFALSP